MDPTVGAEKGGECEVLKKVIYSLAPTEAGLSREVLHCLHHIKSFRIRTAVSS